MHTRRLTKIIFATVTSITSLCLVPQLVNADETSTSAYAFPEQYMIRTGAYFIERTNTEFSINTNNGLGLGTAIDFDKDLGGEKRDTVPRIDAYYRFNDKHRINFSYFSIKRSGKKTLKASLDIGTETFAIDESLSSDIEYTLYKVGYGYSFYRSPKVELSFSAGLNITTYDFEFVNKEQDKSEVAGVTVPLPVFGLRMAYFISPNWSMQYVVEAFAIELEDKFRGNLLNFELSAEYRLFKNFALGAGVASLGLNADVTSDKWRGSVTDRYAGITAFGTFYF